MTVNKIIKLTFGIGLSGIFCWLILRQIDGEKLLAVFRSADFKWLGLAIIFFIVGYVFRIARWQAMLLTVNPALTWIICAGPFMASFAANNVLPFRAGDVLRAFAFNKQLNSSPTQILATLLVERLLDLLMVLLILAIVLNIFDLRAKVFFGISSAILMVGAGTLILILWFPRLVTAIAEFFCNLCEAALPVIAKKVRTETTIFTTAMLSISQARLLPKLFLLSVVAWLAEGGVFWCTAKAILSLNVSEAAWLALPVGTLATLIPSTPGYVGTFDFFVVKAMTVLGNELVVATAFALLVHIILWLPPTLLGGFYLLFYQTKPRRK